MEEFQNKQNNNRVVSLRAPIYYDHGKNLASRLVMSRVVCRYVTVGSKPIINYLQRKNKNCIKTCIRTAKNTADPR